MRPWTFIVISILVSMSCQLFVPLHYINARAEGIPDGIAVVEFPDSANDAPRELQLEVFINGNSTKMIAAFQSGPHETFSIAADQLRNVGIYPSELAVQPDGLVDIARLPGTSFDYNKASQSIYFTADFNAMATRVIDAHDGVQDLVPKATSSVGGLVNYTIFANTGGDNRDRMWDFEGVSSLLEGRIFSPLGVLTTSYIASSSSIGLIGSNRLDSTWAYSNPKWTTTFRAGDIITGGLGWTRQARLGGFQIQRNFGLRSDLVTMPLPELSGSAAVPSSVDIYVNSVRRVSQQVPSGPFQIINLPVVTGSGKAKVVVRDALGRETISETPFYASADLLSLGLWDYSAEVGWARRFYGVESNDYDSRLMGSASLRYGLTDRLTIEGHAEGGGGLISGGAGAVFGIGPYGVGSLAAASSIYDGKSGYNFASSVEFEALGLHFFGRTQRTFGDYLDIAAITADSRMFSLSDYALLSAAPSRALDQVSVSIPIKFDPSTLNFSYTNLETIEGEHSQLLGLSFNRPIGKASFFVTAFKNLKSKNSFGFLAGISMPIGKDIYASTGMSSDSDGMSITTDLVKNASAETGDNVGWKIRETEGSYTNRSAAINYVAPFARVETAVEQNNGHYWATSQVDGAVVFAGRDVFLSNRIDDAFTVVDVGAPGIDVLYENRLAGRTNLRGNLLIPNLRSYERNQITIDPTNLPLNATVSGTREVAVPADRSGTVVKFDVNVDAQAGLVILRDEDGKFLKPGSSGTMNGSGKNFVVGYDGQAYISGLERTNRIVVDQSTIGRCVAEFGFTPREGEQVLIDDAICSSSE